MIFRVRHSNRGCPILAFFARMGSDAASNYRIGYDATWSNKLAPAFPTPALRKLREERGTRFIGAVKETKGRATRPSELLAQFY